MEPKSVDYIFADPPYFLSSGGISCQNGKQVSVNKGEWDYSKTIDEKLKYHRKWIALCREVLKDNGTIMQLWSYVEAVSQMQYIIQSYNGGYRIVPANQDKVRGVDLKDGKAQENQPIIVYQA